ncbi:MAG: protein kinase, partial [Fuerstiella sp.]
MPAVRICFGGCLWNVSWADCQNLVLERIFGGSLSEVLEDTERLPISRIIEITNDVANGLAAAHEVGIVHRDLKPG